VLMFRQHPIQWQHVLRNFNQCPCIRAIWSMGCQYGNLPPVLNVLFTVFSCSLQLWLLRIRWRGRDLCLLLFSYNDVAEQVTMIPTFLVVHRFRLVQHVENHYGYPLCLAALLVSFYCA
jgi:hypothetical protein